MILKIVLITLATIIFLILLICLVIYFLTFFNNVKSVDQSKSILKGEEYQDFADKMQELLIKANEVPYEDAYIQTKDSKKLHARVYIQDLSKPICLMVHGYKGEGIRDFAGGLLYTLEKGNNAIIIEHRGHRGSQGRTISFGVKERYDVLEWIKFINKTYGEDKDIYLYGISMGAATVLMSLDLGLPKNVKCCIADCPYSSPLEIICDVAKKAHYPLWIFKPFIALSALIFGRFDITKADSRKAIKNANIPVLIIHGTNDTFVPPSMSKEIKEANPGLVTRFEVEGAPHGLSFIVDNQLYTQKLDLFFKTINRIKVNDHISLIKYFQAYEISLPWYQDKTLVKQVDDKDYVYDLESLSKMYNYLNTKGDLYYIMYDGELCGDITLLNESNDIAICIEKNYQNKHIGRTTVLKIIEIAKAKGIKEVYCEIYDFNLQSQKMFTSLGFEKCGDKRYKYVIL